jgi:hypothetical protein
MRERRDHLDFATLPQTGVAELKGLDPSPLVTTAQERSAIHTAAEAKGKALTDDETAKALSDAAAAKRKRLEAEQKRKGKNAQPISEEDAALTDDDKQDAITAKEKLKLGGEAKKAVDDLKKANLASEQATWVDVHERDEDGKRKWGNAWGEVLTKDKDVDLARSSLGVMRQVAELVLRLESATGGGFAANNYHGHGGGSFQDRGRSVDLAIPKMDPNGFFDPQAAVDFLLKLDSVADVEWRVLYDDYRVAKAVNQKLQKRRVSETANTSTKDGVATNVNWHGPLVTHFHLDLAY